MSRSAKLRAGTRCLAALLVLTGGIRTALSGAPPSEAEVKAAFLFQFAKFLQWPDEALPDPSAPLIFGVRGDEELTRQLESVCRGRSIHGRSLVAREVRDPKDAAQCQVLFLGRAAESAAREMLDELEGRPVLTVGESAGFIDGGGGIGFISEGHKLRFEVNLAAADRCGLIVSSKMLALARRVIPATRVPGGNP